MEYTQKEKQTTGMTAERIGVSSITVNHESAQCPVFLALSLEITMDFDLLLMI
jgi:hypothetical protein